MDRLSIDPYLDAIRSALSAGHLTLSAPPGSGKTTRVPLALLDSDWLAGQKIIMLEPRRPAARMAALRMAAELDEQVGATVGYQVRFERVISAQTRIEVLTEGLLTRRLQSDPELLGVGLVIFDEFHERSLQADLGLALTLDVCKGLREDLRVLVMSATLDGQRIQELIGGSLIQAEGGLHPVEVKHLPKADADWLEATQRLVVEAARNAEGDILVFLPGLAELNRVEQGLHQSGVTRPIFLLHGQMTAEQQQQVLVPPAVHEARIVLSTDIAETSLTIQGISVVVDSGKQRRPEFDPNTGLTRLVTRTISKASAIQRAGRAGRLGPGQCFRAWTESQHQTLDDNIEPEILRSELSGLVLELAGWGVADALSLSWLDAPPKPSWDQASELLQQLEALDAQGRLTAAGRAMLSLPLPARLAHLILGAGADDRALAVDLAALLSEPDCLRRPNQGSTPADLGIRLQALQDLRQRLPVPASIDKNKLNSVLRLAERLLRQAEGGAEQSESASAGALVSLAFPERIAKRRAAGEYLLASGQGAQLPPNDGLVVHEYLAVAHLDAGSRNGRIYLALPLSEQEILHWHQHTVIKERLMQWDQAQQRVTASDQVRYGSLIMRQQQVQITDEGAAHALLCAKLREAELQPLPWTDKARQFQARVVWAAKLDQSGAWPDLSDAALADELADWLLPWLPGIRSFKALASLDMMRMLTARLDWSQQQRLEQLLPERYECASGASYALDYISREVPCLSLPLQEMYGCADSPKLVQGHLPVLLELLSPAGRPLQLTHDLASFWANSYDLVKKEMKGRYPKHHWPDDPANAQPVRLKRKLAGSPNEGKAGQPKP